MLRSVTPITVKAKLRSESFVFGKTADIAMAAEAPQMATDPPVSIPKRQPCSNSFVNPNLLRILTIANYD